MRQRQLLFLLILTLATALTGCSKDSEEKGSYDTITQGLVTIEVDDNYLYFVPTADGQGMMITYDRTNLSYERLVQMNGGVVGEDEGGSGIKGLLTYQGHVNIPATVNGMPVTAIDQYAFSGNAQLLSVTIPASVTDIGPESFAACPKLSTVLLPNGITEIKAGTFCGNSVTTQAVPASVKTIGRFAFLKNTQLTTVTFDAGSQLETIEASAFSGCTNLTTISLPATVKTIGQYAFRSCEGMKAITIPASVKTIGEECFNGCKRLATYHIQSPTPPVVSGSAAISSSAKIYIPAGSLAAYQSAAYWNTIASTNYIEE